jgi:hypothetical protein
MIISPIKESPSWSWGTSSPIRDTPSMPGKDSHRIMFDPIRSGGKGYALVSMVFLPDKISQLKGDWTSKTVCFLLSMINVLRRQKSRSRSVVVHPLRSFEKSAVEGFVCEVALFLCRDVPFSFIFEIEPKKPRFEPPSPSHR